MSDGHISRTCEAGEARTTLKGFGSMNTFKWCRTIIVTVACIGVVFPFSVRAQELKSNSRSRGSGAAQETRAVRDVTLGTGGTLRGTVFDAQAHRVARRSVVLTYHGKELARTETNDEGRFGFRGLRGGVYGLSLDGVSSVYRVWTAAAAPPHSISEVALVTGEMVQRGQRPFAELFVSDPIVMGVILAAAIAIPVAVHNSRSDRPAS